MPCTGLPSFAAFPLETRPASRWPAHAGKLSAPAARLRRPVHDRLRSGHWLAAPLGPAPACGTAPDPAARCLPAGPTAAPTRRAAGKPRPAPVHCHPAAARATAPYPTGCLAARCGPRTQCGAENAECHCFPLHAACHTPPHGQRHRAARAALLSKKAGNQVWTCLTCYRFQSPSCT